MKFISLIVAILALVLPTLTFAATVTYDQTYDKKSTDLDVVACSNGANGLKTRGFTTFGSLPKFPYIGGAQAVKGWNSTSCGTCWKLTYTNPKRKSKSINVLAIDTAAGGFNIALAAMNDLTSGQAKQFGRVSVTSKKVAESVCGL